MVLYSFVCVTRTIATLRLTDLTFFVIKWIRHNMSNHEGVQSCVDISNFDVQLFLSVVDRRLPSRWLYNSVHCVVTDVGGVFRFFEYNLLCFK
jgi:hypothetical protein